MAVPENGEKKTIKVWIDFNAAAQATPVQHANQAAVQIHDHELYLTLFHVSPPVLLGDPEDQIRQLRGAESFLPDCVARINMTPRFAKQLLEALKTQIDQYDKAGAEENAEESD